MSCSLNFETDFQLNRCLLLCWTLTKTAFFEELGIAKVESEIILWESKDEQMIFD